MTTTVNKSRAKRSAPKARSGVRTKAKPALSGEPNAESLAAIEEAETGKLTPTTLDELRSIWENA